MSKSFIARPAASGLEIKDAMIQAVEIGNSFDALVDYLKQKYDFLNPSKDNVKVRWYCGKDERIDWDETYLVTVGGNAVLFASGGFSN